MTSSNDLKDAFGNRMKKYESLAESRLCPGLPICVRIDGRAFHTFTRGMSRPYDRALMDAMTETTKALVKETHACIGYTQSDEISLVLAPSAEPMFDGRVQKLSSVLASVATATFNAEIHKAYPEKPLAHFDCRVFNVPSETEAANEILWREFDATKNSVSTAARAVYSHTKLDGKNSSQKLDMLADAGINWYDYPARCKRGTYVRRIVETRRLTDDELRDLPEKHAARQNPDLEVTRARIGIVDMPVFSTVANREDVIFRGAAPICTPAQEKVDALKQKLSVGYGSFTDPRDGHTYRTITIGGMTWMAENLDYDCGDGFDRNQEHPEYGGCYEWDAAKRAAPPGWHLPTRDEWARLIDMCGGKDTAGIMLKAESFGGSSLGFDVLPGGYFNSSDHAVGSFGCYWASTEYCDGIVHYRGFGHGSTVLELTGGKYVGMSVRLVQDSPTE